MVNVTVENEVLSAFLYSEQSMTIPTGHVYKVEIKKSGEGDISINGKMIPNATGVYYLKGGDVVKNYIASTRSTSHVIVNGIRIK